MTFYGINLFRKIGKNRGLISRAGPDFQHPMVGFEFQGLGHAGHDVGLRDRLAEFDRQSPILVGLMSEISRQKYLSRQPFHHIQQALIPNAALDELGLDHFESEVFHVRI